MEDYSDRGLISTIALLTEGQTRRHQKGDRMAILRIEDLSGSTEAVVFRVATSGSATTSRLMHG
ncbi:hypothetical protein [Synechococcus elongatus]|uniref:hypothetical protein n=1 Tax=Synechococcus elongatus TaxID=32046 RepID=UPI0030CE992A